MPCYIISPQEVSVPTFNYQMMKLFEAEITTVPIAAVHDTIEETLMKLKSLGKHPYFIEGGGHGNIGTEAYVQCYREIKEFEEKKGIFFDYIFLASGTGTTQAGLICGQLICNDDRTIVGISVARKNPRGRNVVIDSIKSYLRGKVSEDKVNKATIFLDEYTSGYGEEDLRVLKIIDAIMKKYGIPLDSTYTGKGFMGMTDYLSDINEKNILFIHTGGTPLFFDVLRSRIE